MWHDNETDVDFLNFTSVADSVAEIVVQAQGEPVSIGISGAWGTGKSSLIKLTKASLCNRPCNDNHHDFVFVDFNAWLYQGYDDARAALMDVIVAKLENEADMREKASDKVKSLIQRVNWLRMAKLGASVAAPMLVGLPPVGFLWQLLRADHRFTAEGGDAETEQGINLDIPESTNKGLLKPKQGISPPKEIQALRDTFEESLKELGVTLVVLIDDLDRCLPETTISTLEAIRLFLFLKNTAFVIAADNDMIKHAVRKHFEGMPDDSLIVPYFDKLIQVPIQVPPLGIQEVRGYMMLLFVENSNIDKAVKEDLRVNICERLQKTWQGERVDSRFAQNLYDELPTGLIERLDTAERLAPIMTTAPGIRGNPRLIKRFLNALSIRMTISKAQGVGVDEAVLAKLLLFERLGKPRAYDELISNVSANKFGTPSFLAEWESKISKGEQVDLEDPFNDSFVKEWLALSPMIADIDLRGAVYVSREHAPLIIPEDRLSSEGAELLEALLKNPNRGSSLKDQLRELSSIEIGVVMDRLLEVARKEQQWGVPAILEACIVVGEIDSEQGMRLAGFLSHLPESQISPDIVPKISDQLWAEQVLSSWENKNVSSTVKRAISRSKMNGNLTN